jgi:hypothetical protein
MLVVVTDDGWFQLRCGPHVARTGSQAMHRTALDDSQGLASAMTSPQPSTVLEMFWSRWHIHLEPKTDADRSSRDPTERGYVRVSTTA